MISDSVKTNCTDVLNKFISMLKDVMKENLLSVILYGSYTLGDFK